ALGEALALLVLRDVQHDLDGQDAAGDELLLELADEAVALLDRLGGGEAADAMDEHVLVMGAVEDADHPGARKPLPDPPQEVVPALLLGGRLERRDRDPLRIDRADHVTDDAALPGRVHRLEDEQRPPGLPGSAGPA